LYVRKASNDPLRMPPLARHVVHDEVVALVKEWILGVPAAKQDERGLRALNLKSPPAAEDGDAGDDNIQAAIRSELDAGARAKKTPQVPALQLSEVARKHARELPQCILSADEVTPTGLEPVLPA
jgi:hypothetical protein